VTERFARVCPFHHQVLEEFTGRLRCAYSPHHVAAWLVVDLDRGEILGAGRDRGGALGPPPGIFLGPRLQLDADVILDLGERRYALPVLAHPATA
jgi:hypothetical protein